MPNYLQKPFFSSIGILLLIMVSVALATAQGPNNTMVDEFVGILPHTKPLPAHEVAPGVVLLQLHNDSTVVAAADLLATLAPEINQFNPLPAIPHGYRVDVPIGEETAIAARLVASPLVQMAEPDYIYHSMKEPNDPLYSRYQWNLRHIGVDVAWSYTTGGSDVTVAILDTGVDLTHPDLLQNLVPGYDFVNNDANPGDDEGHGTHVASIVAAGGDNGMGIAGISWQTKIMPVKVLDNRGRGSASGIAQGIVWATDHGADVINLSLGSAQYSETVNAAVQYATQMGVLVVAAAGNYYDAGNPIVYPAALNNVLAVAAVNDVDGHASYSSSGNFVDLAAPGGDVVNELDPEIRHWIPGAYLRARGLAYAGLVGTSQAAPHVAGIAALLLTVEPSLTVEQLVSLITGSAVDVHAPGWDEYSGYGRIDAARALHSLLASTATATPVPTATATPTPENTATPTPTPTATPVLILHANEETRINSSIIDSQSDAAVVADGDGNLSVIWHDGRGGKEHLYSAHLERTSKNWGPNFSVTGNAQSAGSQSLSPPTIVLDKELNLHAVWIERSEAGDGILYHSVKYAATTTWAHIATLNAGTNPNVNGAPAFTISADGTLAAAWTTTQVNSIGQATETIWWSRRPAHVSQWSAPALLHNDEHAIQREVALTEDGSTLYAAWAYYSNGTASLKAATLAQEAANWSGASTVMPLNPIVQEHELDLAVTSNGTILIAWVDQWEAANGNDLFLIHRHPSQGVWSVPVQLTDGAAAAQQQQPRLATSDMGVALVWHDNRHDAGDIFVAWSGDDLTEWTRGKKVNQDKNSTLQEDADAALDPFGNTTVVWNDSRTGDAGPEIYVRFISANNRFQLYLSQIESP
ncbi:S8 family serine peptidase [bacterium]|nr:S8 family serine peptidase [bacterium]